MLYVLNAEKHNVEKKMCLVLGGTKVHYYLGGPEKADFFAKRCKTLHRGGVLNLLVGLYAFCVSNPKKTQPKTHEFLIFSTISCCAWRCHDLPWLTEVRGVLNCYTLSR